jgi:hypothetical protein
MSTHGTEDSAPELLMLYILLLIGACVIRVMHVRFRPWRVPSHCVCTVALIKFASSSLRVKVHVKKKSGGRKTRR